MDSQNRCVGVFFPQSTAGSRDDNLPLSSLHLVTESTVAPRSLDLFDESADGWKSCCHDSVDGEPMPTREFLHRVLEWFAFQVFRFNLIRVQEVEKRGLRLLPPPVIAGQILA